MKKKKLTAFQRRPREWPLSNIKSNLPIEQQWRPVEGDTYPAVHTKITLWPMKI